MTERLNRTELMSQMGFPASLVVKNLLANASDTDLISGSERSTEEGNGDPLQYTCLGKSHGQRNLVGCSPWHCRESDMTSVQFSSVTQLCPTLCNPKNCSTPGLPIHHQLPEFTQTHVHRVSDAIQPSHPLSSPVPPAPNPSQYQSFFQ